MKLSLSPVMYITVIHFIYFTVLLYAVLGLKQVNAANNFTGRNQIIPF